MLLNTFVLKVPLKLIKVPEKLKWILISEPIKEAEMILDQWHSRWVEYICTQTHEPIKGFLSME